MSGQEALSPITLKELESLPGTDEVLKRELDSKKTREGKENTELSEVEKEITLIRAFIDSIGTASQREMLPLVAGYTEEEEKQIFTQCPIFRYPQPKDPYNITPLEREEAKILEIRIGLYLSEKCKEIKAIDEEDKGAQAQQNQIRNLARSFIQVFMSREEYSRVDPWTGKNDGLNRWRLNELMDDITEAERKTGAEPKFKRSKKLIHRVSPEHAQTILAICGGSIKVLEAYAKDNALPVLLVPEIQKILDAWVKENAQAEVILLQMKAKWLQKLTIMGFDVDTIMSLHGYSTGIDLEVDFNMICKRIIPDHQSIAGHFYGIDIIQHFQSNGKRLSILELLQAAIKRLDMLNIEANTKGEPLDPISQRNIRARARKKFTGKSVLRESKGQNKRRTYSTREVLFKQVPLLKTFYSVNPMAVNLTTRLASDPRAWTFRLRGANGEMRFFAHQNTTGMSNESITRVAGHELGHLAHNIILETLRGAGVISEEQTRLGDPIEEFFGMLMEIYGQRGMTASANTKRSRKFSVIPSYKDPLNWQTLGDSASSAIIMPRQIAVAKINYKAMKFLENALAESNGILKESHLTALIGTIKSLIAMAYQESFAGIGGLRQSGSLIKEVTFLTDGFAYVPWHLAHEQKTATTKTASRNLLQEALALVTEKGSTYLIALMIMSGLAKPTEKNLEALIDILQGKRLADLNGEKITNVDSYVTMLIDNFKEAFEREHGREFSCL